MLIDRGEQTEGSCVAVVEVAYITDVCLAYTIVVVNMTNRQALSNSATYAHTLSCRATSDL